MKQLEIPWGLSYDDVLLIPQYSEVLPAEVSIATHLTNHIILQVPLVASAMDTVTESSMAIAIALAGGIGFIHKNLSPAEQCHQVDQVKTFLFSAENYPLATYDPQQKLRVGAAIGIQSNTMERAEQLIENGVDVLLIDSAHAYTRSVLKQIRALKKRHTDTPLLAGNVADANATKALIDEGVDAVKVGIGPGSICTTRIVAGVGVPQLTAVITCAEIAQANRVPIIADGGVRFSSDIIKALGAGASTVMLGRLFAGAKEAPGKLVEISNKRYKEYRGMGSAGAMQAGSADRYFQAASSAKPKYVPEGVEAMVPYAGPLQDILYELLGGVRAGMGYLGAADLNQLRERAQFIRVTSAGMRESHVHDVIESE